MCSTPFARTRFLIFKSQLKKLNCSILFLLAFYVKDTFKILHFQVKFENDLAQVGEVRSIASCNILAVNKNPLEDFS